MVEFDMESVIMQAWALWETQV